MGLFPAIGLVLIAFDKLTEKSAALKGSLMASFQLELVCFHPAYIDMRIFTCVWYPFCDPHDESLLDLIYVHFVAHLMV